MYIGEPGTGDDAARAAARLVGGGAARLAPHARLVHVPGVARIASKGGAAHAFWTCRGHMTSPADAWLCAALLPAFDVAVLLLFLSELEAAPDLPVPVACKEAVALSRAYSGDEQQSHRHVNGLLASYAREHLGRDGDLEKEKRF